MIAIERTTGCLVFCWVTALLLVTTAGCDTARVSQLSDENERLAMENSRLYDEIERLREDLDSANERIEEFQQQRDELTSAAMEQVQELMKQWGAGMNTAKELGLPELKDFNLESLLNPPADPEDQSAEESAEENP